MNAAELDLAARRARFIAGHRRWLIEAGMPEATVAKLSDMAVVEARATFTGRHLLGAPGTDKGADAA